METEKVAFQKVLIISANDSLSRLMGEYLKASGYQVILTRMGKQALDIIQTSKLDLVIMDWWLPDVSGEAIIRAIRAEKQLERLPIMLTGTGMEEEDTLIGLEAGADTCLHEALHPRVFVARVRSMLRRAERI